METNRMKVVNVPLDEITPYLSSSNRSHSHCRWALLPNAARSAVMFSIITEP